jgi:hypothetical protein
MDTTEFAVLVGRLERESDRWPRLYRIKLLLVIVLGFLPLALTAAFIVAALATFVVALISGEPPSTFWILGFVLAVFASLGMLRALLTPVMIAPGRELSSDEAPSLFEAVDGVIQKLADTCDGTGNNVCVDTMVVDREFAISLQAIARWGVFGKVTYRVHLGLPMLQALGIAEVKALLAHEIAHLGNTHNRFDAWVYRQRTAWAAVAERFAEPQTIVDRVLAQSFGRYASFYLAYSLVSARQHELSADRAAARATHAGLFGRALIKSELIGRFLAEVFWTKLFEQVERVPEPQYLPYSVIGRAIHLAQKQWQRADWLHEAARRYPPENETHPALGERLAAIEAGLELPTNASETSALALLGDAGPLIVKEFDEQWRAEYVPAWRKRHDAIREARWKITQYENLGEADLKPEDLWEKANLLLDIAREREAVVTLQQLVARQPVMAKAQFLLGRLLLERADEHGLQHLALAAQHDTELLEAVGELGYGYLVQRGRRAEAQRFWTRVQAA